MVNGIYRPDYETAVALPGSEDFFVINGDADINAEEVSILETETVEIGQYKLIQWITDQFDGASNSTRATEGEYLPSQNYFVLPSETSDNIFRVIVYFGAYNPETWGLKAYTKVKYFVKHAQYIPKGYTGINEVCIDDLCESTIVTEYYSLQGLKINSPSKGAIVR